MKAFLTSDSSLDVQLLKRVKAGLLYLLKKRMYFSSEVSTPYFYTLGKYNFFRLIIKCVLTLSKLSYFPEIKIISFITFLGILNCANTEKENGKTKLCRKSAIRKYGNFKEMHFSKSGRGQGEKRNAVLLGI